MSYSIQSVDENYWQRRWDEEKVFVSKANEQKPSFYCLEMYPYPSGKMHMGHVRNYSIGDAVARYKRMMGFDVLYPMGFDSFGLPAENAAIKEGGHPHDITEKNMASITKQIKQMGFSYDWNRMVKSHDPNYYKWNQWFFLKFYESGLAFEEFAPVNWCEPCNTVLANEQVKAGRCWRCNGPVEQKEMSQWFLDIPKYAQELVDGLEQIQFPENVAAMQRDWLGRSEGAEITFEIEDSDETITVFTTRPDTLFGVTFLTLAPEHPLAKTLVTGTKNEAEWQALYNEVSVMTEFDRIKNMNKKKGVPLGKNAIHPLTGEKIPIWSGNFVIASYGTGAVMAVPAHDERDFDFAKKFSIPIRRTLVMTENGDASADLTKAETDYGWMVNTGNTDFEGLYGEQAITAVIDELESKGSGERKLNWKIRPWLISRQRYWGTPIPIIHCDECGTVPVPEQDLPVELPRDIVFGKGNPLETSLEFKQVKCPTCGKDARRETDTMDTFVDSSWYFLRFTDATNNDECFSKELADHWMNVDFYCGGIEHAQMHLIYARFWTKALRDIGLHSNDEPFNELLCQGMVNKAAPWCESCSITLSVDHVGMPCPQCGDALAMRSAKMSKSLGNTVSPEDMIEKYGADTVRLFILFAANPTAGMDWSDTALEANYRVMLQLRTMPETILNWGSDASPIDDWLIARLKQRVAEFSEAMDSYDLRRAVEISHYELIKDVNWYSRRGGNNAAVGRLVLESWTYLISVSTPHLAEEWGRCLSLEEMVSASEMSGIEPVSKDEEYILDYEFIMRAVLENSRKIKSIAEKHLDGQAQKLTLIISPEWKNQLSRAAINYLNDGGNVKQFIQELKQMDFVNDENIGQILSYWNKKMLSQVFKWDDKSKSLILDNIDEVKLLKERASFIANELDLNEIEVIRAEDYQGEDGRENSSLPLSPSIKFA
ncbi:MAG: leucine--tRNA ligase [Candidatus Poseidoniaceae archaeon]|nr:leucine--tRNA ligase [Candidatus Poseidoniaceae archaeon]